MSSQLGYVCSFSQLQGKLHHGSQLLFLIPSSNLVLLNLKQSKSNQGFKTLRNYTTTQGFNKTIRDFAIYSNGVEPGSSSTPSPTPSSNSLSWIVAVVIAIIGVPFIAYKCGPLLKNKVETAIQMAEDVVEAVEKIAEEVEKVAEGISDTLPEGGKLKGLVDFVETLAEKTAKEAGVVDDFIDKVQDEEKKVESIVESINKSKKREKEVIE